WTEALIAVLVFVGLAIVAGIARASLHRRHVYRILARRDPAASLATCVDAFPDIDQDRVMLAYLWVQQLVDMEAAPICADDDLWRDLRIDQGEADDKLESSYEWRGEEQRLSRPAREGPAQTVRDLMDQVLAYGYEGYSRVPRNKR